MKKIKKWSLSLIGIISLPVVISAISFPIILTNNFSRRPLDNYNLFSTFDNILDNLISLGVAPDYHTTSFSGAVNYSKYLEGHTNDKITNYTNIVISNKSEVDRQAIFYTRTDTIILNENMKTIAYKFDNIVNNVAYSSRGDSSQARYNVKLNEGGYVWDSLNSTDNALRIMASYLDKFYTDKNSKNRFTNLAENIIQKNIERISFINKNNKEKLDNVSIGIIYSQASKPEEINSKFVICTPYVYPMLYAEDPTIGIGMEFPTPKDAAYINTTHGYYDTSWRINDDGIKQIEQFKNKFDYLIYCAKDLYNPQIFNQEALYKSNIKEMLKDPNSYNTNLIFSTMGEWYNSAWANIGKNYILDDIVKRFQLKDIDQNLKWTPVAPNNLKRIREF